MRFVLFLLVVMSIVSCSKDYDDELLVINDENLEAGIRGGELEGATYNDCEVVCSYDGYPSSQPVEDRCNLNPVVGELDTERRDFSICFDVEILDAGDPFVIIGSNVHDWNIENKKISPDGKCMVFSLGPGKNLEYSDLLNYGFQIDVTIEGDCVAGN